MSAATSDEVNEVVLSGRQGRLIRLIGLAGVIAGMLMIVVAIVAWIAVTNQLRAENITIPDDAPVFAGEVVDGPIDAFVQAGVINMHALEASGGKTYAELDQDDAMRQTMMTASFLRASLFTSVVAYGVALFAAGVGIVLVLFGWALRIFVPASTGPARTS